MANWFARPAVKAGGGWVAGNQTTVAGPTAKIVGSIPTVTAAISENVAVQTTRTATATIKDSANALIPDGTILICMENNGAWVEVSRPVSVAGAVSFTKTQFDPHPDYIFVLPKQANSPETLCTTPVVPV